METKKYLSTSVLDEARKRIAYTFNHFDKIALSFSGGKDSTVMFHLVADEAIKRNRKFTVMIVDLEAQYSATIEHVLNMVTMYKDIIEVHWVCLPISLSNAVSNFEPRWYPWEPGKESVWVRQFPEYPVIKDPLF